MNFVIYIVYYVCEMWETRRGERESRVEGMRGKFVGEYLEYQLLGKQTIGQESSVWRCRVRGSEGELRNWLVRHAVYIPPKQQSPITFPPKLRFDHSKNENLYNAVISTKCVEGNMIYGDMN